MRGLVETSREGSVERDLHVGVRNRFKVVEVDPSTRELLLGVARDELAVQVGSDRELLAREVEQRRHVLACRHLGVGDAEVVKERMAHGFDRRETGRRRVLEQFRDEVNRLGRGPRSEHLDEGMGLQTETWGQLGFDGSARIGAHLDLRELVLHVIRVHRLDLFASRGTENLDDFDELIDSDDASKSVNSPGKVERSQRGQRLPRFTGEERLSQHEFSHDTSR